MKVNIRPHTTLAGIYTLDWRPDGIKGKRERLHVEGYAQALSRKSIIEGSGLQTTEAVTLPRLKDIYGEYLHWSQKYQAEATHTGKKCRLEQHIIPALGDYRAHDLTQRILDNYGANMARGSYSMDINHIKALIGWMVKRKLAKPLTWSPEMPSYKAGVKHLPSAPDIQKFITALRFEQHRTVCTLMLYTGLRWNEAKHLRWENYQGNTIMLVISKTNNAEIITIPSPCAKWFEDNKKPTGYIFSSTKGKTCLTNLERPLRMAFKKSGIYMTAHMFRHASATFLYELTNDIYAVQHHLRHSRVTTSQIYTRYSAARRRGSVEALVDMIK